METEIKDSFKEHLFHQSYQKDCSECYKQKGEAVNRILTLAHRKRRREELGFDNQSALNPNDGSSPWDRNPLE